MRNYSIFTPQLLYHQDESKGFLLYFSTTLSDVVLNKNSVHLSISSTFSKKAKDSDINCGLCPLK